MRALILSVALAAALAPFGVEPHAVDGADSPPGFLLDGPGLKVLTREQAGPAFARFPVGERLEYGVSYYGVPIGRAVFEVARVVEHGGARYVHLVATARTNDFFSAFYRVDDRHEAWIETESGAVARTRTRTLHGPKEAHEEVRFDWETHYVHEHEVKFQKGKQYEIAFDFGPHVFDVSDAFYALRTLPVREGLSASLPVYASEKVHGFHVEVTERGVLSLPLLGRVETFEVSPSETIDGVGESTGAGRVVVLAEAGHVPVVLSGWFRASSRIRIGGMRAELVGFERAAEPWPPPGAAPFAPPVRAETREDGRTPEWDPPPDVLAARARTGVQPQDERAPWPAPEAAAVGADPR
jgi:hypothetical protein